MRLINFGVGELSDRLSILTLKVLHGGERGQDVTHWRNEQQIVLQKLGARTLNGSWFESYTELAAINGTIWEREDDLREWRKRWEPTGPDSTGLRGPGDGYVAATALDVAKLAIRLQELNDERAQLIEAINKDAGDFLGQEKL